MSDIILDPFRLPGPGRGGSTDPGLRMETPGVFERKMPYGRRLYFRTPDGSQTPYTPSRRAPDSNSDPLAPCSTSTSSSA